MISFRAVLVLSCVAFSLLTVSAQESRVVPQHYIVLFSYQQPTPLTRDAHIIFATVLRCNIDGSVETVTISWLPTTGVAHPLRLRPEPGKNFTLEETVRMGLASDSRISMWGPYLIRPQFYDAFVRRKAALDSGRYLYRAIDTRSTDNVVDCIHAITDLDLYTERRHYPLYHYGDAATKYIVSEMLTRGVFLEGRLKHEELVPALQLNSYPITHREPPPDCAYPLADLRRRFDPLRN